MATEPAVAPAPSPTPPAPPSPSPAPRSPSGVISDQTYDQLDPGPEGQGRYARVRDQNNNPQWVPRSDLSPDPGPEPKAAPAPGDTPPAPASVADGKLRIGEGETAYELSADNVKMLMAQKAESDLRKPQIPASAADYKPELPVSLKMPDGITFQIDVNDPAYKDLANFAHSRGWDQEAFSTAIGIFANREARQAAAFAEAQRAEVQKLGANGTSRVTAVETWLRAELGDDLANGMRSMMVTEKIVRGFEKLAGQRVTQGAAPISQAHRTPEPSAPGRVSDEEYGRMTSAERWEYARSFPQSQFYPDRKNGLSDR